MPIVPDSKDAMISFYATHVPVWADNAAAIGLSVESITTLEGLLTSAQDAVSTQAAKDAEKEAATAAANDAAKALRSFGAGNLATIKAYAKATGDPSVYTIAQIPAPADPTPAPAPGMPYDIDASIDNNGNVVLAFKADNAQSHTGTFFEVRRQLNGQSGFTLVGSTGTKSFVDTGIEAGTASAVYNITAKRGELSSATCENIYVPFASGGNGQLQIKAGGTGTGEKAA
ncbi:MAG: hypothetical protein NCW75_08240 [Phycisphaera sp.]|nr:MAG: hypothetical protein NCW75_08240 [Phycisphaera sp.]